MCLAKTEGMGDQCSSGAAAEGLAGTLGCHLRDGHIQESEFFLQTAQSSSQRQTSKTIFLIFCVLHF